MKKFCIIINSDKDEDSKYAEFIKNEIEKLEGECYILPNRLIQDDVDRHYTDAALVQEGTDFALVLGGDGTLIQASIDLVSKNIPMLGVNIGTVGFLTEVDVEDILEALQKLFTGDYELENRLMLEAVAHTAEGGESKVLYALNDAVLFKRGNDRLITTSVYSDGELLDTYNADGVIISTPTGSTGYNLSAGGPVMVPDADAVVVTPICPHSLNKRSIVLSTNETIKLSLDKTKEGFNDHGTLVMDGRSLINMKTGDFVDINVSKENSKFIKFKDKSFFKKMRRKFSSLVGE
ncbi:MAG: NAD(+)/NADH kinase [Lachnospiraceae bacterium]|nr:NAD(+)/NADH kinase [Lachnospiraceae bacterium]